MEVAMSYSELILLLVIFFLIVLRVFIRKQSSLNRVNELRSFLKQIIDGQSVEIKVDGKMDEVTEVKSLFLDLHRKMENARKDLEENYHKLQLSNLTLEEKYALAYTLQLIQEEIGRELDSNQLLKKTLDILLGVFGSRRCMIYMVDENQNLVLKEVSGVIASNPLPAIIPLNSDHIYARSCNERRVFTDYNEKDVNEQIKQVGSIVVPLNGRHSCLGIMVMENDMARLTNQDLMDFARLIAQELSLSMENAYLYDKMRKMAIHDGLTGVYNRMYLMNYMVDIFEKKPQQVSVIIFDLDHFKMVNDKFGHLAGDMVLKTTAAIVQKMLQNGILARYGGEEFVMVLPEVDPELAYFIAEKIRCAIEEHEFISEDGVRIPVTLSAGLASYPIDSDSYEVLLQLADEALYEAKNSGRNRVCVASSKSNY